MQCMRECVRGSAGVSVCEGRNNRRLLWWKRVQGRLSSKDVPFGPDEGAALDARWKYSRRAGLEEAICVCLQSAEGAQQ